MQVTSIKPLARRASAGQIDHEMPEETDRGDGRELQPDWSDWRWQLDNSLRRPAPAPGDLPVSVTPYYRSLIDESDPNDPIGLMAFPAKERAEDLLEEDPIREEEHAIMPGLVQRYPDRVLLLVSGDCPVHCRHCTRRIIGRGSIVPAVGADLDRALAHIASDPRIRDIIVSGGEPLLLDDDEILGIVEKVREISSVEIVRLATRAPVTLPMRITASLAANLAPLGPIFVNTQFNHPRELTPEAVGAVARLVDAGIPVNNQAVLLAGVNDSFEAMKTLCLGLLRARVRPYYLFMCDLVAGTERFRVPLDEAVGLMARLRGRISGLAIPQLVIDLPGGHGKIPIVPEHVVSRDGEEIVLRAPGGELVRYPAR